MKSNFEVRTTAVAKGAAVRVTRQAGGGSLGRAVGYASVFGVLTTAPIITSGGRRAFERIIPGAFQDSLRTSDVRALWNHNDDFPLGRMSAGTLRLKEDGIGLGFALDFPDSPVGQNAFVSVSRGDVTGVSFGFNVPAGGERIVREGERTIREVTRINLIEVSPVTFPAFDAPFIVPAIVHKEDDQQGRAAAREARLRELELEQLLDQQIIAGIPSARGTGDLESKRRYLRLLEIEMGR